MAVAEKISRRQMEFTEPFADATAEEIAWVAGLFEGEGCFRATGPANRYAYAIIVIREKEVLERVQKIVGCGRIHRRTDSRPNHSITWAWQIAKREESVRFMNAIWPWLSNRRKDQAKEAWAKVGEIRGRS
jgi:hypothetical protein